MDMYFKAIALMLITVILSLFLGKLEKDITLLISLAACCIAGVTVFHYLDPVFALLSDLSAISSLQNGILDTLLKAAGITLISEIAGTICTDAGNGALGKMLHLLSSCAILYISIPVFQILLDLLTEIIGAL